MGNPIDLKGKRVGRLTVLDEFIRVGEVRKWKCLCDCGEITYVKSFYLINNKVKSCGCLQREIAAKVHTKHNMAYSRIYHIYKSMKDRCFRARNKNYSSYGGRGITICQEWLDDFMNFYNWAMANGYQENLSIDRIDNNKGYSPDNCRWVDEFMQANNHRNTIKFEYMGKTLGLKEWCRYFKHGYYSALYRYRAGKSFEEIFNIEVKN